MTELMGWMVVLAVVVAIACIFMLSSQLEQHTRRTTEMMFRSNEMLLTQLERLASTSTQPPEPTVGVVLDRRIAHRRDPLAQMRAGANTAENGEFPHRRLDDLLSA